MPFQSISVRVVFVFRLFFNAVILVFKIHAAAFIPNTLAIMVDGDIQRSSPKGDVDLVKQQSVCLTVRIDSFWKRADIDVFVPLDGAKQLYFITVSSWGLV
jgi:hypothetical protein